MNQQTLCKNCNAPLRADGRVLTHNSGSTTCATGGTRAEWDKVRVRIRSTAQVHDEYIGREGTLVNGSVHFPDLGGYPLPIREGEYDVLTIEPSVPPPPPKVNALLVKVGVFMGDHAQDVTVAVDVDPDETMASFVRRTLIESKAYSSDRPQHDWRVEIRLIEPIVSAEVPAPAPAPRLS